MRGSTLARLAVAGTKTDLVRVWMTAFGSAAATLAWLCAATVAALGLGGADEGSASWNEHYRSQLLQEPGLRPGVIATVVLLTIPVLALVAQSARLGAPARDRRIAAIRLAGATSRQAVAIGAVESGVAALVGSVLGLAGYLIGRVLLDDVDAQGQRALPTDVLPAWWAIGLISLLLPAVVTLISARLLHRVVTTPLGVVRQAGRARGPRPWPGLLIVAGVALFAGFAPLSHLLERHHVLLSGTVTLIVFYVGVVLCGLGVSLGTGWLAYTAGRVLNRFGRRPAARLAAARLMNDPWQGARAFGVLTIATLFGGGTAAVYAHFATMRYVEDYWDKAIDAATNTSGTTEFDTSYLSTTRLVGIAVAIAVIIGALGQLVSLSESIVSRRRTYASLVATGVPRSVLVRTQLWQSFVVAVPVLTLAAAVGLLVVRGVAGGTVSGGQITMMFAQNPDGSGPTLSYPSVTAHVPIPWGLLSLTIGGALAAVALTVGIGLMFLRASTSVEELRTG